MAEQEQGDRDVDQFLNEQIDTVPHLEALLLLWNSRPKPWSVEDIANAIYVAPQEAREILEDLARRHLIANVAGAIERYGYEPEPGKDRLLAAVDATYRRELIRVTRLIHSKPPAAVRAFARAFRIKKERE